MRTTLSHKLVAAILFAATLIAALAAAASALLFNAAGAAGAGRPASQSAQAGAHRAVAMAPCPQQPAAKGALQ